MAGIPLAATPMAAMSLCRDSANSGSAARAVIWSCQRSTYRRARSSSSCGGGFDIWSGIPVFLALAAPLAAEYSLRPRGLTSAAEAPKSAAGLVFSPFGKAFHD